jgi:signal recognition particle GTPase
VNDVLKQFNAMKKMMQEMGKMQKAMTRKGGLPKMRLGR